VPTGTTKVIQCRVDQLEVGDTVRFLPIGRYGQITGWKTVTELRPMLDDTLIGVFVKEQEAMVGAIKKNRLVEVQVIT
jgi:hypothetical protein